MVSFCAFDFANEYHLLSNHKVFARVFQAKTFSPRKGKGVSTSLHLGRILSSTSVRSAPAVTGEGIDLGRGEYFYSLSSIDWARLASILTPGPIVEVIVMCLM